MSDVTVTQVARNFAEYVNRVAYRRESFTLLRGKKPLAELRPLPTGARLSELPGLLASLPRLTEAETDELGGPTPPAMSSARHGTHGSPDRRQHPHRGGAWPPPPRAPRRHGEDEAFLSVITASELLHGVHSATQPDMRARRSAFVEGVLERFPLLAVDLACARAHAQLWADLSRAGTLIAPHDLWLAATCIAHGLTMVTGNVRRVRACARPRARGVGGLAVPTCDHWVVRRPGGGGD